MHDLAELIDETVQLMNRCGRPTGVQRKNIFNALTQEVKDVTLFHILTVPAFNTINGDMYFIDQESHLWLKEYRDIRHHGYGDEERYYWDDLRSHTDSQAAKSRNQEIDVVDLRGDRSFPHDHLLRLDHVNKLRRALKKRQKSLKRRYPKRYQEWLRVQRAQDRHPSVWRVILYGAQGRPNN